MCYVCYPLQKVCIHLSINTMYHNNESNYGRLDESLGDECPLFWLSMKICENHTVFPVIQTRIVFSRVAYVEASLFQRSICPVYIVHIDNPQIRIYVWRANPNKGKDTYMCGWVFCGWPFELSFGKHVHGIFAWLRKENPSLRNCVCHRYGASSRSIFGCKRYRVPERRGPPALTNGALSSKLTVRLYDV